MIKKIFNFQFSIFNSSKGFTVLESIVAILILSLSISGVFSSVQQSLSQAAIAKDEVKAFYLAQEAIEIIRNKRDANQLNRVLNGSSNTWLYGIAQDASDPCYFGKTCQADANPPYFPSLTYCGNSWESCTQNLKQDSNTFLYGYVTGGTTNFKREMQIEPVSYDTDGNLVEVAIIVHVSWTKGSLPLMEFKAKTLLFNWI
jgi:type II secretory pathway pseudopilin PulG